MSPFSHRRNPTDITLPTVGSEAVDPPPGSHEDPEVSGWLFGAVSYAGNVVWELPGAIVQTYRSGEMRDSLEGLGASAYDQIYGNPLTWLTGKNWKTQNGSVYGNEEAFQNGRAVGDATGFVMNMVVTVSGAGGLIKGTITGIRAIQAGGGLIQVAQMLTNTGQTVNVVVVNGEAVVATAEILVSLGVSAEVSANLMAAANNAGQGGGAPNTPTTTYKSIGEALGDRLKGFTPRKGGLTKNNVNNTELLNKLREIEPGKWQKVYKDGLIDGKKVSLHYFESPSGKVFDPAIKPGWSN